MDTAPSPRRSPSGRGSWEPLGAGLEGGGSGTRHLQDLANAFCAEPKLACDLAERVSGAAQLTDLVVSLLAARTASEGITLVRAEAAGTLLRTIHDLEDLAAAAADAAEATRGRLVETIESMCQPRFAIARVDGGEGILRLRHEIGSGTGRDRIGRRAHAQDDRRNLCQGFPVR